MLVHDLFSQLLFLGNAILVALLGLLNTSLLDRVRILDDSLVLFRALVAAIINGSNHAHGVDDGAGQTVN